MSQSSNNVPRLPNRNGASLRTQQMSLFPTLSSVKEATELMESKLPITSKNELYALLMTFQNTVLNQHPNTRNIP